MEFRKYQHIERFGTTEVEGIEFGKCFIFPKIDGTNASIWIDENGELQAGSRKRHLSIEDGKGFGEGIVIKNYEYKNKYGRQTWTKIVTSEFKEKHSKEMGAPDMNGKKMIEEEISIKYVTKALCEKVKSKIETDNNGFSSKNIPQLLNTVYYDVVKEESWNFVKEHRNPIINFKTLQHFVFKQVKQQLPETF